MYPRRRSSQSGAGRGEHTTHGRLHAAPAPASACLLADTTRACCVLNDPRLAWVVMDDTPRLLARNPASGYVTHTSRALRHEPEAVSASVQDELTRDAGRAARDRDRREWTQSRDRLEREVAWLYSRRFERDVTTQIRALQRQVDRLDERLGRR